VFVCLFVCQFATLSHEPPVRTQLLNQFSVHVASSDVMYFRLHTTARDIGDTKEAYTYAKRLARGHHGFATAAYTQTDSPGAARDRRRSPISKKGKVFPYSLPSVGPGADPGVQAVSPQVT